MSLIFDKNILLIKLNLVLTQIWRLCIHDCYLIENNTRKSSWIYSCRKVARINFTLCKSDVGQPRNVMNFSLSYLRISFLLQISMLMLSLFFWFMSKFIFNIIYRQICISFPVGDLIMSLCFYIQTIFFRIEVYQYCPIILFIYY